MKPQPSKMSCVTVTKEKVFGLSTISSEVLGFFLFSVDGCFFHCLTLFSHTTTHVFMCVSYILSLFTMPKKIKHQKQQLQLMTSVSGILQTLRMENRFSFFSILSKFLSKEGLTTELSSAPLWFRLISVIASVTHSLVLHL